MPKQSFDDILKDLDKKKYSPIYFLEGAEPYFIDFISDHFENKVLSTEDKEFNQTILYGRDIDMLTLISAAKRFPMMAEYQVIIVKEAQELKDLLPKGEVKVKSQAKDKLPAISPLEEYLAKPLPSTILVFCFKYSTIDKRKALGKLVEKNAILFNSEKIKDNKLVEWIARYAASKNIRIQPKATQMLADHLGTDLSRIANEINKLLIAKKPNEEITVDDVFTNIGISKDYNVFELQAAINQKDILKANKIIAYFANNPKEHPFEMTIALFYGHFSKILMYQTLADKSPSNVASQLKVNPYFVRDYETAAKNYSLEKLIRIISYLHEYDLKGKGMDGIAADKGELMKELMFKILH